MKRLLVIAAIVAAVVVPGNVAARGTLHPTVCTYHVGPVNPRTGLPTVYYVCRTF